MNLISNINTLTKIKHYDSLFIESDSRIKRDKRYFKNYRPIYDEINHIIQIIKSSFNNELLLVHISKINNISVEEKMLRLRNAYNGVLNLLYYYNNYTNSGKQITELVKYLDTRIANIDNIDISEFKLVEVNPTNTIEYEDINISENEIEDNDTESEEEFDEHNQNNSDETDYEEEEEEELNNSIYENIKQSIHNGSNNIRLIVVRVITSFINAFRSIFSFF